MQSYTGRTCATGRLIQISLRRVRTIDALRFYGDVMLAPALFRQQAKLFENVNGKKILTPYRQ